MRGAIPPSPNSPSWLGAQLKHRDNCTFYLLHTFKVYVTFSMVISLVLKVGSYTLAKKFPAVMDSKISPPCSKHL